jgi:hypothetical protein
MAQDLFHVLDSMVRVAQNYRDGRISRADVRFAFAMRVYSLAEDLSNGGYCQSCSMPFDPEDVLEMPTGEAPKDSPWIEMGDDGFPVDSDDSDYVKEILTP